MMRIQIAPVATKIQGMKTILWAAITANGNYMHGDSDYSWKKEVFEDFDAFALGAGNCIVGRKTFEEYVGGGGSMGDLEVVVVSRSIGDLAGATVVASPRDALRHLEKKGFGSALVGGGDSLLNSFLDEGLADDIVFNITPEMGGPGNHVSLSTARVKPLRLLESREIGAGILRLHYQLTD